MEDSRKQRTLDAWLFKPSTSNANAPSSRAASSFASSSRQAPYETDLPRKRNEDSWRRGTVLAAVAKETQRALPDILKDLPDIYADESEALFYESLPRLKPDECPKRTATGKMKIKVINDDTFNAAIELAASKPSSSGRVAVLNMASHVSPGGGWLKGARAQEEALCYRSSLYLSLHRRYYPWKQRMGLYSPDVVIIRSDQGSGHDLLVPGVSAKNLPVVSVLSIAALRTPPLDYLQVNTPGGVVQRAVFARPSDRELTKLKMRLCLRMAARRDHGLLVLGALGCGAFKNPPREIADCWLEVLREDEFKGGWWEEVWFAVFDPRNEGNLEVFEEKLEGIEI